MGPISTGLGEVYMWTVEYASRKTITVTDGMPGWQSDGTYLTPDKQRLATPLARATYLRGANPIPWIYTIAHRTSLDEIRKRKRSRVRLSPHGTPGAPDTEPTAHITGVAADQHPDPAERHEASNAAAGALAALAELPENQRQALLLTKVHGRSIAEAAMITGSTQGAIKQRAHRAYVTLRRLLGKGDGDAGAGESEAAAARKEMA